MKKIGQFDKLNRRLYLSGIHRDPSEITSRPTTHRLESTGLEHDDNFDMPLHRLPIYKSFQRLISLNVQCVCACAMPLFNIFYI